MSLNRVKEKKIPCYPWATPTEEQKCLFDTLRYEEQLKMVQEALREGLESGISDQSIDDIIDSKETEI
ncbi:hypothetical protein A1359_12100 [Methylomonas lenta]|uniref:Uncharacterized protein n=1 Tax=Methylomonas lenta TaxID=980561 RepID=A0A177N7W0_9GAMM|nr:hypothetical protein [Methylomonas lenta]OAI13674.1 hypothetical protein A1359_12100 [Methylomonas lenta]